MSISFGINTDLSIAGLLTISGMQVAASGTNRLRLGSDFTLVGGDSGNWVNLPTVTGISGALVTQIMSAAGVLSLNGVTGTLTLAAAPGNAGYVAVSNSGTTIYISGAANPILSGVTFAGGARFTGDNSTAFLNGSLVANSNVKLGAGTVVGLGSQTVVVDGGSEARLQVNSTDRAGIYLTAAGSNGATIRANTTLFEVLTAGGVAAFGDAKLLVGTTTPTTPSNGAVQLATHTTSGGGIGLGPTVSLYSNSTNNLTQAGGADPRFNILSIGGTNAFVQASDAAGQALFGSSSNNAVAIRVNNTAAVTFTPTTLLASFTSGVQLGITGDYTTNRAASIAQLLSQSGFSAAADLALSGWLTNASTSNVVYTTGAQTINGAKTFAGVNLIVTGGNVGIGTTSPLAPLHVVGNSFLSGSVAVFTADGGVPMTVTSTNTAVRKDILRLGRTGHAVAGTYETLLSFFDADNATYTAAVGGLRGNAGNDYAGGIILYYSNLANGTQASTGVGTLIEGVRLTSNGFLGIGTNNPSASLHVTGTALFATTAGSVGIGTTSPILGRLQINQAVDSVTGGLTIVNSAVADSARLWVDSLNKTHLDGGGGGTSSILLNAPSSGVAGGGLVGIGTGTPGAALHILNATKPQFIAQVPGSSNGGVAMDLIASSNGGGTRRTWRIATDNTAAGDLELLYSTTEGGTPSTPALSLLSSNGNVGVGLTVPAARFHVSGGDLRVANGPVNVDIQTDGAGRGYMGTQSVHPLDFITSNTVRMTLNTGGYLGIGTTGPLAPLQVTGSAIISHSSAAALGNATSLLFGTSSNFNAGTYSARIQSSMVDSGIQMSDLAFSVYNGSANVEAMRIRGSGNVGIGTTGALERLHVSGGNLRVDGNAYVTGSVRLRWQSALESENSVLSIAPLIQLDSNNRAAININSSNTNGAYLITLTTLFANGDKVGFGTGPNPSEGVHVSGRSLRVDGNTYLGIASGNVGIGTAVPAYKLEVSGSFGATTKSFDIPHGGKPGYRLVHGVVESDAHRVFHTQVLSGAAFAALPPYWSWLVDEASIHVTLTPIGRFQPLYVAGVTVSGVYVGCDGAANTPETLHCTVRCEAIRKDVPRFEVEPLANANAAA